MGPRLRYLLLAAVLGAATAVLPAIATSAETPTVSGLETNKWSPMEVTISPSGSVIFKNASKTDKHGVVWESGPETPSCSGVPSTGQTHWEGSCAFAKSGTYDFYCSVHGKPMSGTVTVGSSGTTTTTTDTTGTTTATTPTTPTTPTVPTSTGGGGGAGGYSSLGSNSSGQQPRSAVSSLAGSAAHVASVQRGKAVHGSVVVATGGSQLTVEVLANTAQLAGAASHRTRVGRQVRTGLNAGKAFFSVSINRRALQALRKRGRLGLLVRLTLTRPGGGVAHRSLPVVLRKG
ncbi:MAG TPA: hypothetical protein VFI66_07765 [Gemmatimonadales bacterium]|nr:hypothetical protein [Gemmatimonadales bacterium]